MALSGVSCGHKVRIWFRTVGLAYSFPGLSREMGNDEITDSDHFWPLLALCYWVMYVISGHICVSRMAVVLSGVSFGHKVTIWVRTVGLTSSFLGLSREMGNDEITDSGHFWHSATRVMYVI